MYAPRPRSMNSGDAPTDLKARTGLSTPPGRMSTARAKSFDERVVFIENGNSPQRSQSAQRMRSPGNLCVLCVLCGDCFLRGRLSDRASRLARVVGDD